MSEKELFGNSEQLDTISRAAAIDALEEWHDEAITNRLNNLPSEQPSVSKMEIVGDVISRQAAIEAITQYLGRIKRDFNQWEGTARIILDHVPSAQPVEDASAMCGECDAWNQYKNYPHPGWIPWNSENLPEESGYYTVTVYDGATRRVTYAKYQKRLKRWELTGVRAYWRVLAWQPKPKPWEGGTQ